MSSGGALVYHYNAFGPSGGFALSDLVGALEDCLDALDSARIARSSPGMRLIVSMSFGAGVDTRLAREAVAALTRERADDMIMLAASGNGAMEGAIYSYPAAWPGIVAIGAVDWAAERAPFSQYNDKLDW